MEELKSFKGPRLVLWQARNHIDHFERDARAFFDTRPYTRVIDMDHQRGEEVHKIRLTQELPCALRPILKDATSNLRDALDHAVYAAAVDLGPKADPEGTAFPFANSATGLVGELGKRKFDDVPPEIKAFLSKFKPYDGGNELLVGLNRIRNPNTHRVIVPFGFMSGSSGVSFLSQPLMITKLGKVHRWHPATNEIEFMRVGFGTSDFDYKVDVSFDVTFSDAEFLRDKPVVGSLREIASMVCNIIDELETETARILRERAP